MLVPSSFNKLCSSFFQDIGLSFSTQEEWIAFARRQLSENEQRIVKSFLSRLLAENHSDAELQQMWFDSGAEIYFPENQDLRGFLAMIRDRIEGPQDGKQQVGP